MSQSEDVEVVLAPDRRYKFHRDMLARNSTLLAGMLTERTAAKLNSKARNAGIKTRWCIALVAPPSDAEPGGRLELIPLDPLGKPHHHTSGLIINENGLIAQTPALLSNYTSIFRAFYNRDIPLDDRDMQSALLHSVDLLAISDYLGCIPVIAKPIEIALIKHGQDLYRSIQKMPWGWLGLSLRIKSEVIFRESVIHCVGNWRMIQKNESAVRQLAAIEDAAKIRNLIERSHKQLVARGKKVELALASLYPGGMATPSSTVPIKREEYAKDVLVWIALSFFRHWFAQKIISEKGASGADSGYELYSLLGKAGEAYMDEGIVKQFHVKFPMTKKALNVLENHLLEIKECVKKVVEEHRVLEGKCMLDTKRFPVDYLTCVEVRKEDLPWFGREDGWASGVGGKRGRLGGTGNVQRSTEESGERRKSESVAAETGNEGDDEGSEDDDGGEEEDERSSRKRVKHA